MIRLIDETSGRAVSVESTQKGLVYYTGYYLASGKSHGGILFDKYSGFCLEAQNYIDSVNNQVSLRIDIKGFL